MANLKWIQWYFGRLLSKCFDWLFFSITDLSHTLWSLIVFLWIFCVHVSKYLYVICVLFIWSLFPCSFAFVIFWCVCFILSYFTITFWMPICIIMWAEGYRFGCMEKWERPGKSWRRGTIIWIHYIGIHIPLGRTILFHREGAYCRPHVQLTKIPTREGQLDADPSKDGNDFHILQKKLGNVVLQ